MSQETCSRMSVTALRLKECNFFVAKNRQSSKIILTPGRRQREFFYFQAGRTGMQYYQPVLTIGYSNS
jgi:hypothetical protein